ncbi:class I SAM-dependent methyltransferase [Spirosoma gilvum]
MNKQRIKKLNVGCGTDIRPDWINMDIAALPGVDIVHNIEKLPLPFEDGQFDEIVCQDILEHVDYIPVLKELHRILSNEGIIRIRVPHFSSSNNYIDPTHKKQFSWRTFEFFSRTSFLSRSYYFDFNFETTVSSRITFAKNNIFFYNYLIEPLVNIRNGTKNLYEDTFLSRLFPGFNIEVVLKK